MRCIEIETAIFKDAVYNEKTIWPVEFSPDDFGCILLK